MISFRFHVVSIIAVFLAMAIGVVVGSTYVDGAVVDGLRNRISTVSNNLDERKQVNDQLESELQEARDYIEASANFAVTDRLSDLPVLVMAMRGVDESAVEQVVLLARRAGATVPGVIWLEAGLALDDEDDRTALAEILQVRATTRVETLWSLAWSAVARELAVPEAAAEPTAGPDEPVDGLLALEAGGFVTVDALGDESAIVPDLFGAGPSVAVITGARAQDEVRPLVGVVASAVVDAGLPTVVADVYVEAPEAPGRGEELIDSLPDEVLAVVALVDHADVPEGQVSTVLALDVLQDGNAAHFGFGSGADSVLPGWTPP